MPPLNQQLDGLTGKQFWRSLEELADTDSFQQLLRDQLPGSADLWAAGVDRRRFLKLLGASLALAGVGGCFRPPQEKIVPFVRPPVGHTPGEPNYYATAMPKPGGGAVGLLVRSNEGRPTKVEGNPLHPASLGATDLFAQASVLTLYDPDRARGPSQLGQARGWDEASNALRAAVRRHHGAFFSRGFGNGLRILTETVHSPTVLAQIRELLTQFPAARWHVYDPVVSEVARGTRAAFGTEANVYYDFSKAKVILSLDADFLDCGPGHLAYVRAFMDRRRVRGERLEMNRLYVVESTPSNTGSRADHRLPLRPHEINAFARAVAAHLNVLPGAEAPRTFKDWNLAALVADLRREPGTSIVIAGENQPPAVQMLALAMNHALGNFGSTVIVTDPITHDVIDGRPAAGDPASLTELVADMRAGRVETLLILGGNPVYSAPYDLDFAGALLELSRRSDAFTAHLSMYRDETSERCLWHLPESHYLESWGDARAFNGVASIIQPLISPLYGGRSAIEVLGLLMPQVQRSGYDLVRVYWRRFWEKQGASGDFEQFWMRCLHDGVIDGTKLSPRPSPAMRGGWQRDLGEVPSPSTSLEVVFRPDPTIYDGRFANNGWLQELPKPLTKITWDNAVLMSRATADRLGLPTIPGKEGGVPAGYRGGEHGQVLASMVRVRLRDREIIAPAWATPGHADDTITLHLGYGRRRAGRVGSNTGFDFNTLRHSSALALDGGATVEPTGEVFVLACTQQHFLMENRNLVRTATLEEYRNDRHFADDHGHGAGHGKIPLTLYPEYDYSPPKPKWAMAIDLTACTGCSACVVACQAENNIPVVGKVEVTRGREMHWLRIDRYYQGPIENPVTHFEPVPCMQCEQAPCEVPCPVEATVHSDDGLNDMVYNRCVGTRYCSNNCPYKVRRFNFLQYSDYLSEAVRPLYNPDVTVRTVGVMEKCTYCVQRIRRAEIDREKRAVNGVARGDWDVMTACQQACPAQAIVFGDANNTRSAVRLMKDEPRNYALLGDLNTQPRTTYLAELRNPNPDLGVV